MSFFSNILGNASEVSAESVYNELTPMMTPNERVEKVFKLFRDMYVFTDRRLIIIDKQGLTGSKIEILSVPYKSITKFSKENAGLLDLDSDLRIWVTGSSEPITTTFKKGSNIDDVYRLIGCYVLR